MKLDKCYPTDQMMIPAMDYFLSRQERRNLLIIYSSKEHPKISKIAKFGCEML
jgi:hypothetical protein